MVYVLSNTAVTCKSDQQITGTDLFNDFVSKNLGNFIRTKKR